MSNPDQSPANSPLQARALELHTKASMPMSQAEELALSELGIDDAAIDELSAEACCTVLLTLLDAEDVRTFTRAVLVHQPAVTSTQVVAPTEAAAMAATVPAGWKLVPEMPTKEMLAAAGAACEGRMYPASMTHGPRAQNTDRYIAMLDAAPQAPVAGQPAEPSPARSPGFESLRLWWTMHEAQWELWDERPADDKVVLQFMGSGASHMVTAGEIRQALDVPESAPKGDSNG